MFNKLRYQEYEVKDNYFIVTFPTKSKPIIIDKENVEKVEGGNIYFKSNFSTIGIIKDALGFYDL